MCATCLPASRSSRFGDPYGDPYRGSLNEDAGGKDARDEDPGDTGGVCATGTGTGGGTGNGAGDAIAGRAAGAGGIAVSA